jgi:signal transduction histidine kinase
MQSVSLLNSTLRKAVADPDLREMLDQQGHAIESMTRLLNALLDISRLESGAVELALEKVALPQVFAGLRADFQSLAESRGIRLDIQAAPLAIWTDPVLLQQLLVNLLANAVKYTDAGEVHVRTIVSDPGVTIEIEDTGVGIPTDKLERIFDEYYQVDTHGTKRVGVGLGLAIVRELVRLMEFTVRISSKMGKGTIVRVFIPSKMVAADPIEDQPLVPTQPAVPARAKARLILIEDNDGVRAATETSSHSKATKR